MAAEAARTMETRSPVPSARHSSLAAMTHGMTGPPSATMQTGTTPRPCACTRTATRSAGGKPGAPTRQQAPRAAHPKLVPCLVHHAIGEAQEETSATSLQSPDVIGQSIPNDDAMLEC